MKKRKGGKLLAALLAVSLCMNVLGGCGKGDGEKGSQSGQGNSASLGQTKGRYVEKTVELPAELAGGSVAQMYAVDNTLHFLVMKDQNEKVHLQEWVYEDGTFKEVTQEWLASMELPGVDWVEAKLIQGPDDTQYLYAGYAEGTSHGEGTSAGEGTSSGEDASAGEEASFRGHLWKGTADGAEEITPEKWSVPDEQWGGYEMIQGLAALDDGNLLTVSYNSLDILSGRDGAVLESEPFIDAYYEGNMAAAGGSVYLYNSSSGQIEKRKNGRKEDVQTFSLPAENSDSDVVIFGGSGSFAFDVLKDGTLIAGSESGIFKLAGDGAEGEWEQLIAGMDTDFSMPDCWCLSLAVLDNGGIYGLFQANGEQKLNFYEYDPDAVSEVTQVLKLYTVYESSLLKQAAAMYHRAHPEVVIEIENEYPQYFYGTPDYDTVYKKLNTMLMGEDAPDILVMDHLNMDSYAQRGLLEDLNDVLKPLEESGEVLSNITGAYVDGDGSRYVVPLQFNFTLAMGRDITSENMSSLEALAGFLSQTDYSYLGSLTVDELVDFFYTYFCDKIVRDKQLDKEALGKYLEYLKAVADNSGMIGKRQEDEIQYGMWDLSSKAKLAFTEADGFNGCMFPMSIVDYIKGDFTVFENRFIPSLQTGICAKSKYVETAKDFLQFALSEQVQNSETYRGFPVNHRALQNQADKDRSNMSAVAAIMGDDGGYVEFESKPYSKEVAKRLIDICKVLDTPVKEDTKIREVLIESLGGYLNGTESLEAAIQRIEDGLKMYLAE